MDYVAGILLAALLSAVIIMIQKRKSAESWTATVTGIREWTDQEEDSAGDERVRVEYRRDDGRRGKLELADYAYRQVFPAPLAVGDRLVKSPKFVFPRKE